MTMSSLSLRTAFDPLTSFSSFRDSTTVSSSGFTRQRAYGSGHGGGAVGSWAGEGRAVRRSARRGRTATCFI